MVTWEDIDTYKDIMKLYGALDSCDRSMCVAQLTLSKVLSDEEAKKFKETWDGVYKELARILECARMESRIKCLEPDGDLQQTEGESE